MTNVLALPSGTELVGDFRIERVLGAGGFGMTYLAEEIALARKVTIKEYFPTDFAARSDGLAAVPRDQESVEDFQWGLDRFIDEAQTLARFDHPNIVRVFRYFKTNGTAYMVLTFEEGQSLKNWLRGLGRAPRQRELDDMLAPLLEALETVHAADYLHRDIAPDNIMIRTDGTPVLIDFGSARGEIASRSRTVSALVKPGYSPYEQYAESGVRQGPWTDIYALGATLYHAISGKRPHDAPSRVVKDDLSPLQEVALASYRPRFLAAVDRALRLDPDARPQSIAAWRGDLLAPDQAKSSWLRRATGRTAVEPDGGGRTVKLPLQPSMVQPSPDAPGAPGQMLDYIEGLKQNAAPAGARLLGTIEQPGVAAAAAPGSEVSAPGTRSPSKPGRQPSQPIVIEKLPVPVPKRTRPPRPKPVRFGTGRQWRSFALKFAMGAAIAGWAIAYKDDVPGFMRSTEGAAGNSKKVVEKASLARSGGAEATRITMLSGHRGGATAVGYTPDGRSIVTAGADGKLKVWNAASSATVRTIEPTEGAATAMSVLGRRALTGHGNGRVALWDLDTGQRVASFRRGEAGITAVGFAREGARLLVSSADSILTVWDASAPQSPVGQIEAHDGAATAVASAERGGFIATGGEDHAVRLWRAGDLSLVRTYRGHREPVSALAFSPDGRHVAAAALDGRIRVWSTSSSSLYRLNSQHKGRVRGLAFSPSGDVLASAAEDGTVQLWNLRQSRVVRAPAEGGTPAHALAFAPDGSRAAVASADGSVRFWDAALPAKSTR